MPVENVLIVIEFLDVDHMDTSQAFIDDNRIKRFINDHRKCPFHVVTLENGENVDEVFRIGKFYFL